MFWVKFWLSRSKSVIWPHSLYLITAESSKWCSFAVRCIERMMPWGVNTDSHSVSRVQYCNRRHCNPNRLALHWMCAFYQFTHSLGIKPMIDSHALLFERQQCWWYRSFSCVRSGKVSVCHHQNSNSSAHFCSGLVQLRDKRANKGCVIVAWS